MVSLQSIVHHGSEAIGFISGASLAVPPLYAAAAYGAGKTGYLALKFLLKDYPEDFLSLSVVPTLRRRACWTSAVIASSFALQPLVNTYSTLRLNPFLTACITLQAVGISLLARSLSDHVYRNMTRERVHTL